MRGIDIQRFTDRDKQEVLGYFELLSNVFDAWNTLQLSEGVIKHFHRELLKYVEKDALHRGDYKRGENKVHMVNEAGESVGVLFNTTPAFLTPKDMQELVEWTRDTLASKSWHPLLVIGNFIVEFLAIHPFQDGNGRLSRVLTNLLLLKEGYQYMPYVSHEKLVEDHKPDYYLALRKSQQTFKDGKETIAPWLEFFLDALLAQSREAVRLIARENVDKLLSPRQAVVWAFIQNAGEAVPGEIVRATGIPRPTVNQALDRLLRYKREER
jgi:Fic family protein